MREGLRSSTVSQRSSSGSQSRRDRADSRSAVKLVSDVGLAGDCKRVRNLLPDLNTEANPSEFDSDWPCEEGYAGDGSECKGTLAENDVGGFVADESIKSKGVDTDGEGETGKDLVQSCIEQCEQKGDGELRNLGAKVVDLNMDALECDDLACNDLLAGEEEVVLEKDKVGAVDEILQQNMVSNQGCDVDIAAGSEQYGLIEPKMDLNSIDYNAGDDSCDLQSNPVLSGCCSENVTSSMDSPGDKLDPISHKANVPEKDKLQVGVKVLRSRVVGSEWCSENITCSMGSPGDSLDTISQKTSSPEKDKLQVGGKVLRSRVVVTINREVHSPGYNRRKRATGCQGNETERRNDESTENFDGQNKKHKCVPVTLIEEENILLKSVFHGEEAFTEELKNDESNGFFDGQNKRDDECWGSSRKMEENADALNSMIDKDETAAEALSNDLSKELVVDPNKKRKVGRGRPRKQHGDNVSVNLLRRNIENPLEDGVKIKQDKNIQLTDHTDKQQKGRGGKLEKRKRGRPKKIDKEIDGKKMNQHDWEGTDKAGKGIKKQDRHQFVEGAENPSGKDQKINSLNPLLHNDEAAPTDELKIKKETDNEGADATNNKFTPGGLLKRKRGRPRKINKENDAPEPILEDQEGIVNAVVVMEKEDTHHFAEGSMRQERKQILEGTHPEVKISSSGTASLSSSRLKRKKENTEEEASKDESNLSSKGVLKVKNSSTREEKNMVRQQIVDMLKSAGWTVEYKPRQGKEYADSVYRSPEGRTHWSVTLAYRVLKQQVETGKAANFCFTPIPEEKLSTLFRIQVRARSDKNKPKQKSSCKKLSGKCKGKKKMDNTSGGEEKTAESLPKRKPSSVRSGKQNRRRCALLVRGSAQGSKSAAEEFMAVSGKHSILSWMIECGVIPAGGKVYYRRRTKVLLEGSITKDGIHCSCCSKLHSVAQFEAHAGNRSCPLYQNLYLDNGSSLLQCQMESWNKQEESIRLGFHKVNVDDNDPNDDTCGICGDGGNLICCDGCPSTFHQACLNILKFPSGDWHCVFCSCKYCGTAAAGVDQDNEKHEISPSLLTCCLCDGKYHRLCAYEKECEYGQSSGSAFCGKSCEQIYERFQRLVGVRAEVGDGYTCTFIKRPESPDITPRSDDLEESKEIENMSKLAVALSVMNECFLPIIDHRSGINLMRHTLYSCGSNFKRLNFRGFFTAILEKEDEIIAAASIRIHGKELAEMPFIGTRNAYRRQGMCRRLLSGIELALRSLAIEKLVIPAVSEVIETWTSVFGFEPLGGLGSEMTHMNVIVFPGVDMLQKPLLDQQFVGETTSDLEEKDIKLGDSCSKKHAEENGLIETKAEDGCMSEKYEPSIEALQDSEKLSSENGSHIPLKSAVVNQEEGSRCGRVCSDTVHSTEENNQSTPANDEGWPDGASGHMVLSSEKPVLVANLSLAENEACEDVDETPKSGTTGITVFEDHISRLAEGGPDDTALNRCDVAPNKADDACSDHILADVTVQPNSSITCPKLEVEVINPLENSTADPCSNSLCNGDLPTSVNDVNNPVEDINDSTCPVVKELKEQSSATEENDVINPVEGINDSTCPVVKELKEQSSATEENLLLATDHSILNGAQATAKTPEHFESDLQIDCNIVPQFNLEKSCNMDSGSNDLSTPATFHACSAPEV